jgi:hypothetical protein
MPLLDHFQAPLYPQRSWESFHSRWANSIADALQTTLPPRYFAEVHMHLGSQVEADVAEFASRATPPANGSVGGLALETWAPTVATFTMPALFPDDLAVEVRDEYDDARVVAVVELVSPRNKDRPDSRRAFAVKCAAYLQRGIGLAMIDIVTNRQFMLHNDLIQVLELGQSYMLPAANFSPYATAYRPLRRQEKSEIDAWLSPLAVGASLPIIPFALRGGPVIPLDLEGTYTDACQRSRL